VFFDWIVHIVSAFAEPALSIKPIPLAFISANALVNQGIEWEKKPGQSTPTNPGLPY
jgi:hypothetical protein